MAIALFIAATAARGARAAWVNDGVPLCAAPGAQMCPAIAPDGRGGAIAVWEDYRADDLEPDIYAQRLTADGEIVTTRCDPEAIEDPAPLVALFGNHPNPFNPSTVIRYRLAAPCSVTLAIYDVEGRTIRRLYSGTREAGTHAALWDGLDDRGAPAASGIYLCGLAAGGTTLSRKIVLLR